MGYAAAAIHYDHTGDEVAVVRAGEDAFGIWVAGSMVPEADPNKAAKLRRSPLSGDWRAVDGNLELTAALAVNVPAFPVYAMDGQDQTALVATSSVLPEDFSATDDQDEDQEDRAWALRELLYEDELLAQWERSQRFAQIFAADGEPLPAVAPQDPVYGTEGMLSRQLDAQFTILEDPEGGAEDGEQAGPGDGRDVVPVAGTPEAGAPV
jgi:hypothetical protein